MSPQWPEMHFGLYGGLGQAQATAGQSGLAALQMAVTRATQAADPPCMLQHRKQQMVGPVRSRLVTPQSASLVQASSTGGRTIEASELASGGAEGTGGVDGDGLVAGSGLAVADALGREHAAVVTRTTIQVVAKPEGRCIVLSYVQGGAAISAIVTEANSATYGCPVPTWVIPGDPRGSAC